MAADMFLKFEPALAGEATADQHAGEIDILNFGWGIAQSVSMSGGGLSGGKANFSDFSVAKTMDSSSPVLALACASGQHFMKATFVGRRAGTTQNNFIQIEFEDAMISSYQVSDSADGGATLPTESITIAYKKVNVKYLPQKSADGAEGKEVTMNWDLSTVKTGG